MRVTLIHHTQTAISPVIRQQQTVYRVGQHNSLRSNAELFLSAETTEILQQQFNRALHDTSSLPAISVKKLSSN